MFFFRHGNGIFFCFSKILNNYILNKIIKYVYDHINYVIYCLYDNIIVNLSDYVRAK